MADPYLNTGSSASSSDPYLSTSPSSSISFTVKKKKGRGNFIDRSWENIRTIATESVPGLAKFVGDTGTAIYHDIAKGGLDPRKGWEDPLGLHSETAAVVYPFIKNAAVSTAETFRHPLRDPVYTALNVLGVGSIARGALARGSEAAVQAGAAEGLAKVGAAAKGYAKGPLPGTRTATAGGISVQLPNSTNALTRDIQKLLNSARNLHPETRGIGTLRTQHGIVNKQMAKELRLAGNLAHVPAAVAAVEGKYASPITRLWTNDPKKMTLTKDHAIRVVVEGVPIEERIALAQKELRAAPQNPALANGVPLRSITKPLIGEIKLLEDVKRYVDTVDGKPVFKPQYAKQLTSLKDKLAGLASTRDTTLVEAGVLNPEAVAAKTRSQMPGRVVRGAEFQTEAQAAARVGKVKRNLTKGLAETSKLAAARQRDIAAQIRRVGVAEDRAARDLTRLIDGKTPEETVALGRVQKTFNTMTEAYNARRRAASEVERTAAALQRAGDQLLNALTHPRESARAPATLAKLTAKHTAAEKRFQKAKFAYQDSRRGADQLVARHEHAGAILGVEQKIATGRIQAANKARIANTGMRQALEKRLAETKAAETAALERAREMADNFITAIERDTGRLTGAEDFTGGEFRIPYQRKPALKSLFGTSSVGSQGSVALPRVPGSLTHPFTGDMLKSGWFRKDTTRLMVETAVEAERFGALLRNRQRFIEAASPVRRTVHDIPIRLEELKNLPFPEEIKAIIGKYEDGISLGIDETKMFGMAYDTLRDLVFPKNELIAGMTPTKGVMFVDKRILGHLNEVNPLQSMSAHPIGGKALAVNDAINNAERFAILYLKPAYAIPNVLGNTFLTLTQQGIFAPQNIARSVRLQQRLGLENVRFVDEVMGDGIAHAISTDVGAGRGIVNFAASKWSKIVDVPFRRSAFLHEAGKLGFETADDFKRLFKDPENRQLLQEITDRATSALIDYSDLSPFERSVIRRVIFFYPWVKGSLKYSGKYLQDHPVQAMLQEQLGEVGEKEVKRTLGDLPSFMPGVFKVGERNGMPLVINPSAAAIFGTPAQVVGTIKYLAAGDFTTADLPKNFSVPLLDAVLAVATGTDPFTGRKYPSGTSGGEIMFDQLTGGLPQVVLGKRLTEDQTGRLYPMNTLDSILAFTLGVAPKPLDKTVANRLRAKEDSGR